MSENRRRHTSTTRPKSRRKMTSDLDGEIDELAARIERTIQHNKAYLERLPEFEGNGRGPRGRVVRNFDI